MKSSLIMMAGLPGTGKSTIATTLEHELGYDLHSLFAVRRDLGHVRYMPHRNWEVFNELYLRAQTSLREGRGSILDSSFANQEGRFEAYRLGIEEGVDTLVIECTASERVAKERMRERPVADGLFSEPRNARAYDRLAQRWESIEYDFLKLSGVSVSHVRYDSVARIVEERVVQDAARPLVTLITSVLQPATVR